MDTGAVLSAGSGITSCDGRFTFIMQGDGNLVLYQMGTRLWASNTAGSGINYLTMQSDGNLVMYPQAGGGALWASNTNGNTNAWLAVQNDGNVAIYATQGKGGVIWSTGTCCH
jgi:hypothetical protein